MNDRIRNVVFTNEICTAGFSRLESAKEHRHEMIQIFIFLKESGRVLVNGQQVEGDCIWIPSNTRHSLSGSDQFCFTMLLDPLSEFGNYIKRMKLSIGLKSEKEIYQKLNHMLEEQTIERFYSFIDEFFYQIQYEENCEPLYDERVEQTITIIREKARENITVSELSHWIGLSESRLSHLFKEQTGLNIKSYILLIKWKSAYLQMLSNKNITISAMEGGFASSSHFSTTNTRFTGITAKQMRKYSTIIKE